MHVAMAAPIAPIIGLNKKLKTIFTIAPVIAENKNPLLSLLTVYDDDKKVERTNITVPRISGGVYFHAT